MSGKRWKKSLDVSSDSEVQLFYLGVVELPRLFAVDVRRVIDVNASGLRSDAVHSLCLHILE
jgi:hypothetical protein